MFRPEHPINEALTRVFDLLLLNLLWLFFCIPILTMGTAYAALYTVTLSWMRGEEVPVVKTFFAAFRKNLKQGIWLTVVFLTLFLILVWDLHLTGMLPRSYGSILYGVILVLLAAVLAAAGYAFPLLARFENPVMKQLGNAWRLAAAHLPQTILLTALHAAPALWFLISPETFMTVTFLWGVFGTAVTEYICSWILAGIFHKLEGVEK